MPTQKAKKSFPIPGPLARLGRILGSMKAKEPDIVVAWQQLCQQIGQKPVERLVELIRLDMEAGGIDTTAIKLGAKWERTEEAFRDVDVALRVEDLARQVADRAMQREQQFMATLDSIRSYYERSIRLLDARLRQLEQAYQPKPVQAPAAKQAGLRVGQQRSRRYRG